MSSSKQVDDARALAEALRYARGSVRSAQDVLAHLRRRGIPTPAARRAIVKARGRGMLDDRAAARLWAEHWGRQGYAWVAIGLKLAAKGFHAQTINETAQRMGRAVDDEARVRTFVAQFLRRQRALPAPRSGSAQKSSARQAGRLAGALAGRGFDLDLIERILNESFDPIPSDAEL